MNWSYRIGRVAGTDIKMHVTFLFLVVWYALNGYRVGGTAGALLAIGFLLAVFACVVLHEFGHIFAASKFGIRTPDVLLLPIGGVARLQRMPEEPRQELLIAIAGPAVTLGIALALFLVLRLSGIPTTYPSGNVSSIHFLSLLMWINVGLLLFNLVPAFPMDGGRVLRATLAHRMGFARATRIAAQTGQALAVVLGLYGLFGGTVFLTLIAVFVFVGAGAEAAAAESRQFGRGLTAADMMVTRFEALPVHARLGRAAELLLEGDQREFPIVDNAGRVEGLLTRENLIKGLSQRGPEAAVAEAMTPQVPVIEPGVGFEQAMERLRGSGLPALPVVDGTGALVGILSLDNVADLLLVRRAQREKQY